MGLATGAATPTEPFRIDLHCHTSASFDSIADPAAIVARAAERGLTHVAVTDHETLDGALRAAALAPPGLQVLVGCEVTTREGDLVFVFLRHPLPLGLSAKEAIEAGHEQGALVGIPHPFDPDRRSLLLDPANEGLVAAVDWVEAWNGRVTRRGTNDQAAELVRRVHVPGIGVSDAHSILEVGTSFTTMAGDPSTPAGLRAALLGALSIVGAPPGARSGRLARLCRPATWRSGAAR